jgi:hypothetical protein
MSARNDHVIPSRTDGEGPLTCKWSRPGVSVTQFPIERSLVVCATRDDSRKGEARRQAT